MKLCAYNAANTFLLTLSFEISFTFFPQGSVFSCYLAPEATEDNWGRWKIVDYFQYFASDLISCCSLSKEYISNHYARCEINAIPPTSQSLRNTSFAFSLPVCKDHHTFSSYHLVQKSHTHFLEIFQLWNTHIPTRKIQSRADHDLWCPSIRGWGNFAQLKIHMSSEMC